MQPATKRRMSTTKRRSEQEQMITRGIDDQKQTQPYRSVRRKGFSVKQRNFGGNPAGGAEELSDTTRIGWMESNEHCVSQWSCPACEHIFHYLNDTDDTLPPKFCPECGRKNLRA